MAASTRRLGSAEPRGDDAARRPVERPPMKVAIAGAGSVGHGHRPGPRTQRPRGPRHRAGPRAGRTPSRTTLDVTWIAADACEVASLDAAGLANVDVVVAATGDDEDNLVISLLAKQEFAVPRVVARVNHPKNQWLFNESWGVDVVGVDPPAAHRPRRGGGLGRLAGPPAAVRRRARPTSSRSRWPTTRRRPARPSPTSASRGTATVVAVVRDGPPGRAPRRHGPRSRRRGAGARDRATPRTRCATLLVGRRPPDHGHARHGRRCARRPRRRHP